MLLKRVYQSVKLWHLLYELLEALPDWAHRADVVRLLRALLQDVFEQLRRFKLEGLFNDRLLFLRAFRL